ncbi:hypothetical protein GGI26_002531 [Coemansia sp. RSA 1358]|nr:hypothetical protein EDC05_002660 [Coemansia umbellata]KAJ2623303.1 hypothetical protein GGI26_002531 [Coemansia sp. RSA 1358]
MTKDKRNLAIQENERVPTGVLTKDHHLSRNGADIRGLAKKGGSGMYNWGVDVVDRLEFDEEHGLNRNPNPQPKVSLANPKEFNEAKEMLNEE